MKFTILIISMVLTVSLFSYGTVVVHTHPTHYENGIDDKLKRFQIVSLLLLLTSVTTLITAIM